MLIPNNRQRSKLFQYANTARFAYNWALAKEQENYKNGGKCRIGGIVVMVCDAENRSRAERKNNKKAR